MGQQQLLLTLLVVIIIGIASVVGLNIFSDSAKQASFDAVRQDMATIAVHAQAWYIKPAFMGGGNNQFTGIHFRAIPFSGEVIDGSGGAIAANANGTYWIRTVDANSLVIRAFPSSVSEYSEGSTPGTGWLDAVITRNSIIMSPSLETPPTTD